MVNKYELLRDRILEYYFKDEYISRSMKAACDYLIGKHHPTADEKIQKACCKDHKCSEVSLRNNIHKIIVRIEKIDGEIEFFDVILKFKGANDGDNQAMNLALLKNRMEEKAK